MKKKSIANSLGDYASIEETKSALAQLTKKELIALGNTAKILVRGIRYIDADDLLNEMILRICGGSRSEDTRRWPKSVNLLVFMGNVMRSIASSYRRGGKVEDERKIPLDTVNPDRAMEALLPAIGGEDMAIAIYDAREQLKQLRTSFENDAHAQAVLDSLTREWTKEETLKKANMSSKDYDSARKRIKRRVEQLK